jgi:hypothetical protein
MPRAQGKHRPDQPAGPDADHSRHFDRAMRDALQSADAQFPAGNHNVRVRFEAVLETRSPGRFHEYRVELESI